MALNTTAIASELLESELFGHERGAFTGADSRRIGRFEQADGGTLFLDEIGDMSPALQTRLLRVLAEGEFYRVGGQAPIRVDVRVIAATNQDLTAAVQSGRFREDLFHRLNVIHIVTPPLRERRDDIPLLLEHLPAGCRPGTGHAAEGASRRRRCSLLRRFDWPGNVRQLVNACRRLTVTAPGAEIQPGGHPRRVRRQGRAVRASSADWSLRPGPLGRGRSCRIRRGKPLLDTRAAGVREDPDPDRARPRPGPPAGSREAARLGTQYADPEDPGARSGVTATVANHCSEGDSVSPVTNTI